MEWSKDWKTPNVFGPDPNIIYYYNQPTAQPLSMNKEDTKDLNVEIKTVDDNVVTERNFTVPEHSIVVNFIRNKE